MIRRGQHYAMNRVGVHRPAVKALARKPVLPDQKAGATLNIKR